MIDFNSESLRCVVVLENDRQPTPCPDCESLQTSVFCGIGSGFFRARNALIRIVLGLLACACAPLSAAPEKVLTSSENVPQRLSNMISNIEWLPKRISSDGACIRIRGEAVIYIDPARLPEEDTDLKADLILITHPHEDHLDPVTMERLRKPSTKIVTVREIARRLSQKWSDITTVAPGAVVQIGGVRIEAIAAYNQGGGVHPKNAGWVGYVVTTEGKRLYHSGDTSFIPEMAALRDIDIAFLTVSPPYQMSGKELVSAAEAFKPLVVCPVHWTLNSISELDYLNAHPPAYSKIHLLRAR